MLTTPYSIYVHKRPLRIAFLIEDKPESMALIDSILAYNRDRWGGRYNPIVLTDGRTLTDVWWSVLEAVDPDVVKSFVPLRADLIGAIDRRISPYLIQPLDAHEEEDGRWHLHLFNNGLSLLPTAANVRMASRAINEPTLVLFGTDWQDTDPVIRRFVESNFGGYLHPVHAVSRALENVRARRYRVTDAGSLVTPLTELSSFGAFTYPIQLCSIPEDTLPDVEYDPFGEALHVVIGDMPTDVAYFWNRPTIAPQWVRTSIKQLWLPVDVATNPELTTALSSWLQRSADLGGTHQGRVRFVSLSLSQERLQHIVEPLTGQLHVFRDVQALAGIQAPRIRQGSCGPIGQDKMDLYRATGTTERLTLQEPDVVPGFSVGEHWMADLYIEFRPERYSTIQGRPLWWQLPRLNALASHTFRRPSRILRTRYPSVLMKSGDLRLDIRLLDDLSVFTVLAARPNKSQYTLDARGSESVPGRTPYDHAQPSEKGRFLSGVLDLFGGLEQASRILEERYWRRVFDRMSGRIAHKDAALLTTVGNKLRRRLAANRSQSYQNDKDMMWLTNYVLTVARSLPAPSRELEFGDFEEEAKKELEDFNSTRGDGEQWVYSREELIDALAGLTDRGVLLMGVQARCPACGYRAWHHIDHAKQIIECGGCNAAFSMPPEPCWHYRLNSLASAAHAQHGMLPVVLVLGQLFMDARSAFLFAPCLDLFEIDHKEPDGDLDIAVILDGKFVIGEVKVSRNLFDKATFDKMERIARRLLPEVVLFASMDREPSTLITREIARLSAALRPDGIEVRWYPLHEYKFDASPVR